MNILNKIITGGCSGIILSTLVACGTPGSVKSSVGGLSFQVHFPEPQTNQGFTTQYIPLETKKFHINIEGSGLTQARTDSIDISNGLSQTYRTNGLPVGQKTVTVIASDGSKHLSAQSVNVTILPDKVNRATLELKYILSPLTISLSEAVTEKTSVTVNLSGEGFEADHTLNQVLTFQPGEQSMTMDDIPRGNKTIKVSYPESNTTLLSQQIAHSENSSPIRLNLSSVSNSSTNQSDNIANSSGITRTTIITESNVTTGTGEIVVPEPKTIPIGDTYQLTLEQGFSLKEISIKVGDVVNWMNLSNRSQTLISRENMFANQILEHQQAYQFQFVEVGHYHFKVKDANDLMTVKVEN